MDDSPTRYGRPSLVWPILLIGLGVVLLLANLDLLPANTWALIARLWPLALIVLGLDLLIGRRSTLGMVLTALIALALVAGVIVLLLLAPAIPALNSLTQAGEVVHETIQAPREGVEAAEVSIDWNPGSNRLTSLPANSANLIEGEVDYTGDLTFDVDTSGTQSRVVLDDRVQGMSFFTPPFGQMEWDISLHPSVVYQLNLDAGSGSHVFDLSQMQLSDLLLDAGSGSVSLSLPAGDYRGRIDGGSGSLALTLPADAAVRVDLDGGSGSFNPGDRMELVSGERDDDGIWETENFNQSGEQIILEVDQGSGSLTIQMR